MSYPTFVPPRHMRLRPQPAPSFLRPWVPALTRWVAGPYLRLVGYRNLDFRGAAEATELWNAFYAGKVRLIVAFRHPYGNDPQVVASAVVKGIRTSKTAFVQFVHGAEVGWWAGPLARWILPRAGGLPVDHGRLGPSQVTAIRDAIVTGDHPLALAPEGQVTYSARCIQRVEPGFARLGFLAAEELRAQGKDTPVLVLPVSLYQRYPSGTGRRLVRVVAHLEVLAFGSAREGEVWERLNGLRDGIFVQAEAWYRENHGYKGGPGPWAHERLAPLLDAALTAAEGILGLPRGADAFSRLYGIRSVGWARLYPDGAGWDAKPVLARRLAQRSVAEAWCAFRHMELADLAWYLGRGAPTASSSVAELADYAENLYDLLGRLSGGNISHRKVLFPRGVEVVFGKPLDLTARLDDYRSQRKDTLARTVADLIEGWQTAPEEPHV